MSVEELVQRSSTELVESQSLSHISENIEHDLEQGDEDIENLCDSLHLFERNTASFRCLAQQLMSNSSLERNRMYKFPPPTDPGIEDMFAIQVPPIAYDEIGVDTYLKLCKQLEIVPISRITNSLATPCLDLKYYGLTQNQIRALSGCLKLNSYVEELILQDNWMLPEATAMLTEMLTENTVIEVLNLRECRIGAEGAGLLGIVLETSEHIRELDLSYNSIGDEGLLAMQVGLSKNTSLKVLNISHNNFTEESGPVLGAIMVENISIQDLDISWSSFNTGPTNKKLFKSILSADRLTRLNIAWNGIESGPSARPLARYLTRSTVLNELDLSNNRLTGPSLMRIRQGIFKSKSLVTVKLAGNIFTPEEAASVASLFIQKVRDPLEVIDMRYMYVDKLSKPIMEKIEALKKTVIYAGILSDYEIIGPNPMRVMFDRCMYLLMKPKKAKARRNLGHFILALPDKRIPRDEFEKLIKKNKMKKIDKDLLNELIKSFSTKKMLVDCPEMLRVFMELYPDTTPPPPVVKKRKKGKKGKKKKLQNEALPPGEGEQPIGDQVAAAPVEGQEGVQENVKREEGAQENVEGQEATQENVEGQERAQQNLDKQGQEGPHENVEGQDQSEQPVQEQDEQKVEEHVEQQAQERSEEPVQGEPPEVAEQTNTE